MQSFSQIGEPVWPQIFDLASFSLRKLFGICGTPASKCWSHSASSYLTAFSLELATTDHCPFWKRGYAAKHLPRCRVWHRRRSDLAFFFPSPALHATWSKCLHTCRIRKLFVLAYFLNAKRVLGESGRTRDKTISKPFQVLREALNRDSAVKCLSRPSPACLVWSFCKENLSFPFPCPTLDFPNVLPLKNALCLCCEPVPRPFSPQRCERKYRSLTE